MSLIPKYFSFQSLSHDSIRPWSCPQPWSLLFAQWICCHFDLSCDMTLKGHVRQSSVVMDRLWGFEAFVSWLCFSKSEWSTQSTTHVCHLYDNDDGDDDDDDNNQHSWALAMCQAYFIRCFKYTILSNHHNASEEGAIFISTILYTREPKLSGARGLYQYCMNSRWQGQGSEPGFWLKSSHSSSHWNISENKCERKIFTPTHLSKTKL